MWILLDVSTEDVYKKQGYWYYDNHNRRPYGSMYQNEMTPDNYFVDQNGVWDGRKH